MMHDHEKSDPSIVAVKPSNKAGQPAAELVEPRVGAEGNARQQSTGRAQYRGTVSQALERIRQAARQRKKEKFTALSITSVLITSQRHSLNSRRMLQLGWMG
jgi:RNA-directed DNA polymerase